jgi:subtilisin family serine protease
MSRFRPLALTLSLAAALAAAPLSGATPRDKVDPWIDEQLSLAAPGAKVGVLVELAARPDFSGLRGTKHEKGAAVYRALTETAARTQGPLLARLRELGVPYRTFWVANLVRVDADARLVAELAERDDVARLAGDSPIRVPEANQPDDDLTPGDAPAAIEWNIAKVNADDVWALGHTGQGAVIGGQDTGYQWDHPALKAKYRGWNGTTADHDYNWHDAIHSGTSPCGVNLTAPCDDHGHGTHTMGTMVGDDGGANQIGMAPGARWISCRNMDQGNGTPTTYIECFQWFLAPTDLAGQNPNPALAPDVINNSWGCPTSEGCNTGNFATMNTVVESLRAAGIAVVVSAGNDGSGCSTVGTPAAIFDAVISVGSTTSSDVISSFSSRGPVTVDGSNRRKPDISAPGSGVRSSVPGNSYSSMSGTSMAGPHVAGAVALLLSADPALSGDVDAIEKRLERSALLRTTTQGCGGDSTTIVPNNVFGWGRLDILKAVTTLLADDFEPTTFGRWDLVCPGGAGCV